MGWEVWWGPRLERVCISKRPRRRERRLIQCRRQSQLEHKRPEYAPQDLD